MVKQHSGDSRFNPKVLANDWYQKVLPYKALNTHHQRVFNTFSSSLVSPNNDPDLERFSRTRATPVSKFTLPAFAKRLQLLQKVRKRDIKQTFTNYTENQFSHELKVLENLERPDGSFPRDQFLDKFPFSPGTKVISLLDLERQTKQTDLLPPTHSAKPKLASSRIKIRVDRFLNSPHIQNLKFNQNSPGFTAPKVKFFSSLGNSLPNIPQHNFNLSTLHPPLLTPRTGPTSSNNHIINPGAPSSTIFPQNVPPPKKHNILPVPPKLPGVPKTSNILLTNENCNNQVNNVTTIPTVNKPVIISLLSSSESSTPRSQRGRKIKKKIYNDFVSDF